MPCPIIPFVWDNAGRSDQEKADCSVRALALVLGVPYARAHEMTAGIGRKPRGRMSFRAWGANLETLGLEQRPDLSCRTLATAIKSMAQGRFLVRVRSHFFTVIDGQVHDLFEPKPGIRVNMVYTPL